MRMGTIYTPRDTVLYTASAEQSVVRKANDRQCKAKARASETELESVVRKANNPCLHRFCK